MVDMEVSDEDTRNVGQFERRLMQSVQCAVGSVKDW